jgi:uncharacterized Zn finger protein (UPF0148 family)
MRHSSLSKLAHDVKDYTLREHAGWSKNSDMVKTYTHTLTGDSAEHVLMCYGINLKNGKKKRHEQLQQEMMGPHCPFCKMVNIPNTQFCSSCHRPLSATSIDTITKKFEPMKARLESYDREKEAEQQNLQRIAEQIGKLADKVEYNTNRLREADTVLTRLNNNEEKRTRREAA